MDLYAPGFTAQPKKFGRSGLARWAVVGHGLRAARPRACLNSKTQFTVPTNNAL